MIRDRLLDQQRQLESRPLPRHPDDAPAVASIEFFQLAVAVGAGSQRNGPVRMKVIDMRKGQKRMERCIDRRGNGVMAERRQRVIGHHLVFVRLASILRFKRLDAIQVEQREAGVGNRPKIAAAAFDGEHADWLAGERIRQIDFRAGVAAAEIGDAQIRAEQVRAVPQQRQLIAGELFCLALVPQIFQARERGGFRHRQARSIAGIARRVDPMPPNRGVRRSRWETIDR